MNNYYAIENVDSDYNYSDFYSNEKAKRDLTWVESVDNSHGIQESLNSDLYNSVLDRILDISSGMDGELSNPQIPEREVAEDIIEAIKCKFHTKSNADIKALFKLIKAYNEIDWSAFKHNSDRSEIHNIIKSALEIIHKRPFVLKKISGDYDGTGVICPKAKEEKLPGLQAVLYNKGLRFGVSKTRLLDEVEFDINKAEVFYTAERSSDYIRIDLANQMSGKGNKFITPSEVEVIFQ